MTLLLALACNDDDVQNADITALSQQVDALNALTEQLEASHFLILVLLHTLLLTLHEFYSRVYQFF